MRESENTPTALYVSKIRWPQCSAIPERVYMVRSRGANCLGFCWKFKTTRVRLGLETSRHHFMPAMVSSAIPEHICLP